MTSATETTQAMEADGVQFAAYQRFHESRPILEMLEILSKTGRKNFEHPGPWEICLCALILKIEPGCKIQRILECLPHHHNPMDEADILNFMAHMGFFCRPAESELYDIDDRLLPGLFIPSQGDPCVVLGRDKDDVLQFFDPVSRMVSTVPPSFDKLGKIWFFQIYDENRPAISRFMRKGTGYSWFRALLTRFKGTFLQVMLAGLILNITALVTPIFIMLVYDRVIAANSVDTLPMLALGAVLAIIFEAKLRTVRSQGLSWLAGRLDNIVGNRIFAHLIGLSPSLIEKASVSAQIARIKTFEAVRDFFSGSMFLSLLEAPFVIISAAAIAVIAGPLVFVPLAMLIGYFLLFMIVRRYVKVAIRLAAKSSSARQQFTIETFEKLSGIRVHGLSRKWQEKFRNLSGREMFSHFHLSWLGMIAETLAHALTVIAAVATVGFGVHFIWTGQISTGALVATMILVWRVLTPFYSLCTMIPRLEQLRNSIHQVNELMDIQTEAEEAKSHSRLSRIRGAISFSNVTYRPSEEADPMFTGLSFDAHPGDFVVLTGSNGTGKASILKLIKALNLPAEGAVYIDGFDIRQLDAPDLRRQIAYVPRIPSFFNGSVMENLQLSNPTASAEDIKSALEMADALDDIMKMPEGLNTIIGSYGNDKLTTSLAMKLSLARAYLHPASILLIDEIPNTLLAGKIGKNLKDYLVRSKGRLTLVMVTYREDYMRLADTIVWLRGMAPPVVGPRDQVIPALTGQGGIAA